MYDFVYVFHVRQYDLNNISKQVFFLPFGIHNNGALLFFDGFQHKNLGT